MDEYWDYFLGRIRSYPPEVNRLLPPCAAERLEAVQRELGEMPTALVELLEQFNGAELFVVAVPLITIFGISTIPALPPLEWAPEWYIDKHTRRWRSSGSGRDTDWAIAMMNYGGLAILDKSGWIREWDTAAGDWDERHVPFEEWCDIIIREGDALLKDE